jgi:hypothetical protein
VGVDIGAKAGIFQVVDELAARDLAILLISVFGGAALLGRQSRDAGTEQGHGPRAWTQWDSRQRRGTRDDRHRLRGDLMSQEISDKILSTIPMGRIASPREIVSAFLFLASDLSSLP